MPPHSSNLRVVLSVLLVLVLVAIANFAQALAIGLALGPNAFSPRQVAADLISRWALFAFSAFVGASVAKERAGLVAFLGAVGVLVIGSAAMVSTADQLTPYNYVSLAVLVTSVAAGALASKRRSSAW